VGRYEAVMKIEQFLPSRTNNFAARRNYSRFAAELKARSCHPTVLIVGAGDGGKGTEVLASDSALRIINSDRRPSNPNCVAADAHDLPFPDSSFDGVVVQAVLEHVLDPFRCVSEIYRVLRANGLVYSETPFMQQVHGAEFDFTRFTFLGHRRLFRQFAEIDSGIAVGPGSAFAWAWEYFWVAFTKRSGFPRKVIRGLSRLTTFWAPLLDPWLSKRVAAYDSASAFYFLGAKVDRPLPDDDLLKQFRGVR
jgi:ubiquinone/menaquinone biosynthesis C-methylase UbiE